MDGSVIIMFILFGSAVAPPPEVTKTFRSDYEYSKKTDAFYKLYIETVSYFRVSNLCAMEGAQLMVPSSKFDIMQVHGMLKRFPDIGDSVWVGNDGQDHESAEETPIIDLSNVESSAESYSKGCDILTRNGEVESTPNCFMKRPFVCKVDAKDAPYDSQCGVYSTQYTYKSAVGSCYRVPKIAFTWDEAYTVCSSDGAHLVVLNSDAERDAVKEILKTAPSISDAHTSYFFFAGIRAQRPTDGSQRVFKTIFNETLEETGFNEWSDGEPNNHLDSEYCGTIFSNNGKYNDASCSDKYGFICEKEVHG